MLILGYDHSFDGFLTSVFDLYAEYGYGKNTRQAKIVKHGSQGLDLFAEVINIATDINKAGRVSSKLEQILGKKGIQHFIWAFLSEDAMVETCLLGIINYALTHPGKNILRKYTDPHVMQLAGLLKCVCRERHRMFAFVRFELMQNGIYFARIEQDFNVLPLIAKHFQQRYQDQRWAIFDMSRHYGIYYDLHEVHLIDQLDPAVASKPEAFFSMDEIHYQTMWKEYFGSVNIKERRNVRLHVQQLPKRYWPYLTEKKQ